MPCRMVLRHGVALGSSFITEDLLPLKALSATLATVGLPFVLLSQRAHEVHPYAFGRLFVWLAVIAVVLALIVGVVRDRHPRWRWLPSYGMLTASTCLAVALAAFSHTIIAEGQVTAMVVPVAFLGASFVATIVSTTMLVAGYGSRSVRRACMATTLVGLSILLASQLPVVQFLDGGRGNAIYPIHGALYAFLAGLLAERLAEVVRPTWGLAPGVAILAAAGIAGYMLQAWFGSAIGFLGANVAFVAWNGSTASAESDL